jgi:hypothetical protein
MTDTEESKSAFAAADKFYFDHLRSTLMKMGQAGAASSGREHLRLWKVSEEKDGPDTVVKMKLTQKLTDYRLRLNAFTLETVSWYIDFLAVEGDRSMPEDEAVQLAEQIAEPPQDAKLKESGYEIVGGRQIFRAVWSHEYNNLPVEGDFIEVLINAKARRAFSYARFWRTPNLSDKSVQR